MCSYSLVFHDIYYLEKAQYETLSYSMGINTRKQDGMTSFVLSNPDLGMLWIIPIPSMNLEVFDKVVVTQGIIRIEKNKQTMSGDSKRKVRQIGG